MRGKLGGDEVKELDMVMERSHRIARDTLESAYSWDIGRFGKTDIVDNVVRVD